MLRVATAAVLIPVLWVAIKLAPPPVFTAIALLFIGGACWECYRMLERRGARPFKGLGLVAGLAVVWSFTGLDPVFGATLPLVLLVGLVVVLSMWMRANPVEMLEAALATFFPVMFLCVPLGYLVGLRSMPAEDGPDLLLLLFICVIFADTAAYCVGTLIGRHRMAPRISPKKSWEGAVGGLLASALGAWIAHVWFFQRLPLEHALVLGLILGTAAILGDLAESMVKRAVGVKDSSRVLPGHGGLLDRADSLLFVGPVLYYYYELFLRGVA